MAKALYLECFETSDGFYLEYSSGIAFFLLKFCWKDLDTLPFKVNFVNNNGAGKVFFVSKKWLSTISILMESDLPANLSRCHRPVFLNHGQVMMVHSGLGAVLRCVIFTLHEFDTVLQCKELLGFRGMCMKACAEVSVWADLCENRLPKLLRGVLSNVSADSAAQCLVELQHLEDYLAKPAIIPNCNSRRRQMLKQTTQSSINKQPVTLCEQFYAEVNAFDYAVMSEHLSFAEECAHMRHSCLAGVHHRFVEGADLTLTDIILFPSLSTLLTSQCVKDFVAQSPHIVRWYNRMKVSMRIRYACETFQLTPSHFDSVPFEVLASKPGTILDTENKLIKKKTTVVTSDASALLDTVQNAGIKTEVVENPFEGQTLDWDSLPVALHPLEGSLPSNRVQRKCQQIENLALAIKSIAKPGDVIVELCAGGGHLGIVVAYLLPECQVLLVENKYESISRVRKRILDANIQNVTLYQSNLNYFTGDFSIGTSLHACGIATDLVLKKCLDANASFVATPCCYGAIKQTDVISYPRSNEFTNVPLSFENYLKLARAADDQTYGKKFMTVVDTDRLQQARELQYQTLLCSLVPLICSPKNNMLIGIKCKDGTKTYATLTSRSKTIYVN